MRTFHHLTYEQRLQLQQMKEAGLPCQQIADALGYHFSSIYREISRGMVNGSYDATYAQRQYQQGREASASSRKPILSQDDALLGFIAHCILDEGLNPMNIEQLINAGQTAFAPHAISRNTIYNAIDAGLIPGVTRETLDGQRKSRMSAKGTVTIPAWIRQELGLKAGDVFTFEIDEKGRIVLALDT